MKNLFGILTISAVALVLIGANLYAEDIREEKEKAYLRTAERLVEMKMYDEAYKVLLEVKELNPSSERTHDLLLKVSMEMGQRKETVKAKPVTKEDLNKVIREVDFTNARLDEVVNYLSERCKVNIVLQEEALGAAAPKPGLVEADEFTDFPEPDESPTDEPIAEVEPLPKGDITIRLKDVPLKAVLKYVLQMKGLTYIVEDYAIVIVPLGYEPPDRMETMIIHLYHSGEAVADRLRHGF